MAEEKPEESTEEQTDETPQDDDTGTYPAKVVKDLRKENATYREKAKTEAARAEQYAQALFRSRVEATGKLASPDELAFDAALLDDSDAFDAAIDELINRKPYLKARANYGEVGQGERGGNPAPVDFSSLLR